MSAFVSATPIHDQPTPELREVYRSVSVEIQEGGEASVRFDATYDATNEPARFDSYIIFLPDDLGSFLSVRTSALDRASASAPGVDLQTRMTVEGDGTSGFATKASVTTDGRFAFVLVAKARNLSVEDPTVTLDGARVIDQSQGGSESVHALQVTEFDGGIAANVPRAHAAADTSARLDIEDRLVGFFECGRSEVSRCHVEFPNGSTQPEPPAGLVTGGPPGTWGFHVDRSADTPLERGPYRLFAADIPLPSEES